VITFNILLGFGEWRMKKKISKINFYEGYLFERYFEEHNPVYAWEAYKICREKRRPVDKWILEYFDHVTSGMMALVDEAKGTQKGSDKKTRDKIYDALGMKRMGPWNLFRRYCTAEIRREGLSRILQGLQKENLYVVAKQVAEDMEVSPSLIYKWYYEWEKRYAAPDPDEMLKRMKKGRPKKK
jgi:hypothetical protein